MFSSNRFERLVGNVGDSASSFSPDRYLLTLTLRLVNLPHLERASPIALQTYIQRLQS